jgi:hypothetical protein
MFIDICKSRLKLLWCLGRESNPHVHKGHRILSPVRLPIPPPKHEKKITTTRIQVQSRAGIFRTFVLLTALKDMNRLRLSGDKFFLASLFFRRQSFETTLSTNGTKQVFTTKPIKFVSKTPRLTQVNQNLFFLLNNRETIKESIN